MKPHAHQVQVANPSMRKAIFASKHNNDRIDAGTLAAKTIHAAKVSE
ncbi:MAG: hypothetical protein ABSG25_04765 [Bryobacteraceae bacterium]